MNMMNRRSFLRAATIAIGGGLILPTMGSRVEAQGEIPWTPIGFTQAGEPMIVYHLGTAPTRVFLLGGQHGGPEANTTRLARMLMNQFAQQGELPATVGLDVMPIANPDGAAAGIRQYLSGVDPNRNWGGPDWSSDAYDSDGRFVRGLGGAEPFSEQETRAMADWLSATKPALVVNYHSAGGFMFGSWDGFAGEMANTYAQASGYWRPRPGGGSSPLPYRATGSMNVWMREIGISGLFIELTTPSDPELNRNMAGLRATLALMAANAG